MNVLVTGANGFIGKALCRRLASDNKVVGVDITGPPDGALNITWDQVDLTDWDSVAAICERYSPDVVIHCAGIAHQKIGAVDSATYMLVNSKATEKLAKAAAGSNPGVCFIFFSSVSVYGEHPQITQITQNEKDTSRPSTIFLTYGVNKGAKALKTKNSNIGVSEDGECRPSSDYAMSKLDAERRLIALSDEGIIRNLLILRLAPVYAREWSLNLNRRVFAPKKLAYLRFGSGSQKMSALARPNLVDLIEFLLQKSPKNSGVNILNIADAEAYEFNTIIQVFKKSGIRPNRPIISIPLFPVWIATHIAGIFLPGKRNWLHSCYDKLASDLVFDNGKMMGTGFRPVHSLETIFDPQITPVPSAGATRVK
jgi:nucleoside-diphosphate-sugar epimerase